MNRFRPARASDLPAIIALLQAYALPTADLVFDKLSHFLVHADSSGDLHACVGIEIFGDTALLRSLAVADVQRSSGLGRAALDAIETHAAAAGVRRLYLLTTTAAAFFERHGYRQAARDTAPEPLKRTDEFASLCPASATFMTKDI